jgi:hypothetical protein
MSVTVSLSVAVCTDGEQVGACGGVPARRFQKLVEHSGRALTERVYAFISFHQSNDADMSRARIARQERLVPALVFAIEAYEKALIRLSRAAKVPPS